MVPGQSSPSRSDISREIDSLRSLPVRQLKERWRTLYRSEPPHRISRELLTRAVAYRIQEQAFGGLKPSTRSSIGGTSKESRRSPRRLERAGTILKRALRDRIARLFEALGIFGRHNCRL